ESANVTAVAHAAEVLPTPPFPVKNKYLVKFISAKLKFFSKTHPSFHYEQHPSLQPHPLVILVTVPFRYFSDMSKCLHISSSVG
ncbi:MAG: hypothetical protein K0Q65_1156, partial [Clostridia bacterium]|nr:hypothetical protein [Clostridia bacterium]